MKKNVNIGYLVFLSFVAALGGFLFGYDTAVISGTIAQVTVLFHLDTLQQGWYVGCALIGSIVGVLFAGVLSDKFGRKLTMVLSAVLFSTSAIGCAICANFDELVVYRIIGGVGIGVVSIISPLYISEVSVAQYRGRLVSLYQLAVTVGFLGAYLVNFQLLGYSESHVVSGIGLFEKIFVAEVWRGMLGMETLPALLFFTIIFFIPESPRWLILKGREERGLNVLQRIYNSAEEAMNQMNETKSVVSETKSEWALLLQPGILKAVIIGVAIAILGQFMGVNAVLYYGPSIFEKAGLSGGDSLFYQVLVGLVNTLTTVLALAIIDRVGRKKLVYYGVSGMVLSLLLIGIYFLWEESLELSSLFLLVCFLSYVFCCAVSICAVVFVLLSEMYPTKVRGLAMSIAGFSLWIGTYLIGQLTPWMLQNLTPAGTFFLFAAMCVPYNKVEKRQEWLDCAIQGGEFLKKYGHDGNYNWYFSLDRQGNPLVEPYNIFSYTFATMAFGQLSLATGNEEYAEIAKKTFDIILSKVDNPKGHWNKLHAGTRDLKNFALPMILCNLALEIEHLLDEDYLEKTMEVCIHEVMEEFYRPELGGIIVENIQMDGQLSDSFEGRQITPGHAIEAMWFIMDLGKRLGRLDLIEKAKNTTLTMLDYGWDKEFGGIYYFMDRKGCPPQQLEWDQKLWWVHIETLISLLKGYHLTGDQQCLEWFNKVHDYTWTHFKDTEHPEWFGYLNRRGEVLLPLKGGKWKGCFHVPRGLYQCWTVLEEIANS